MGFSSGSGTKQDGTLEKSRPSGRRRGRANWMRAPGALGLSVGDPSPSRCPARSRTSRFRRRRGRAGPTPCGTLQGTALGLRTPGHVKVRAPPGQTLSAWRPRPNAKRGWGSAAPAQGVPRTTPDRRGPRSSPAQRWEGVPAAPFFLRHPHSGPRTSAPEPRARAPAWGPARTRSARTGRCQVPPYAGVARNQARGYRGTAPPHPPRPAKAWRLRSGRRRALPSPPPPPRPEASGPACRRPGVCTESRRRAGEGKRNHAAGRGAEPGFPRGTKWELRPRGGGSGAGLPPLPSPGHGRAAPPLPQPGPAHPRRRPRRSRGPPSPHRGGAFLEAARPGAPGTAHGAHAFP